MMEKIGLGIMIYGLCSSKWFIALCGLAIFFIAC